MKQELLKNKELIVYEDEIAAAILPENAATKGHIIVIPKKPTAKIEDITEDDLEHIFYLANFAATTLFETLGVQGTNIITNEDNGFSIDIIARTQDDGLNFQWKPTQLQSNEMVSAVDTISSKIVMVEEKPGEPKNPPKVEDQKEDRFSDKEDNYLIKQLERIP